MQLTSLASTAGAAVTPTFAGAARAAVAGPDGVAGLWTGWRPAVVRASTYGALRLGLYTSFRDEGGRWMGPVDGDRDDGGPSQGDGKAPAPLSVRVGAGIAAGALAAAVTSPLDLAKVRLQRGGGGGGGAGAGRGGAFAVVARVARAEGVLALWRGVSAGAARAAGLTAAQCATYDGLKAWIGGLSLPSLPAAPFGPDSGVARWGAVAGAGAIATVITAPFDVAKQRMFVHAAGGGSVGGAAGGGKTPSLAGTLVGLIREGGVVALTRGAGASWLRLGPQTALTFAANEWIRKSAGLPAL